MGTVFAGRDGLSFHWPPPELHHILLSNSTEPRVLWSPLGLSAGGRRSSVPPSTGSPCNTTRLPGGNNRQHAPGAPLHRLNNSSLGAGGAVGLFLRCPGRKEALRGLDPVLFLLKRDQNKRVRSRIQRSAAPCCLHRRRKREGRRGSPGALPRVAFRGL